MMKKRWVWIAAAVPALMSAQPAQAEIVLSQLIVDLGSGAAHRQDIEIWNNGEERAFVSVTPAEIVGAGLAAEHRREESNPEKLGLLVSPNRLILEPGQHKLIRIAALGKSLERERVYRVTVKPVVGELAKDQSGLKVLVGYDVLALVRPANSQSQVSGRWEGSTLIVKNDGNESVELIEGKQCSAPTQCETLPAKRLYAGAEWRVPVARKAPVEMSVKSRTSTRKVQF
ncbi:fimbrial biogenesis chaperone [Sphingomonas edaphi]|nr:fimbria/pilus periplasmic chaperone [Sphingomonas edaphi]